MNAQEFQKWQSETGYVLIPKQFKDHNDIASRFEIIYSASFPAELLYLEDEYFIGRAK